MNGWTNGRLTIGLLMDEYMDRLMVEWIDLWMDKWMLEDECIYL